MPFFIMLIAAVAASGLTSATANADTFHRGDGVALVWVTIEAKPGEGIWEACRRIYQRDVYHVRRGPGMTVRCNIDHSRI